MARCTKMNQAGQCRYYMFTLLYEKTVRKISAELHRQVTFISLNLIKHNGKISPVIEYVYSAVTRFFTESYICKRAAMTSKCVLQLKIRKLKRRSEVVLPCRVETVIRPAKPRIETFASLYGEADLGHRVNGGQQ